MVLSTKPYRFLHRTKEDFIDSRLLLVFFFKVLFENFFTCSLVNIGKGMKKCVRKCWFSFGEVIDYNSTS